jgi:hypothetical protein
MGYLWADCLESWMDTVLTTREGRIEYLRGRLQERDIAVEEVWDYLALAHQPMTGMQMQHLASFIDSPDLPHFWSLVDWWSPVPDKPATLSTPTIQAFCWHVNHAPGTEPVTFNKAMFQFYQRAVAYLQANDIDPQNPGETADERKRRRNRARMATVRGHRKVPDKVLKDDEALSAQVRGLEAQIDQLKLEAAEVDTNLKAEVIRFQEQMIAASNRRKGAAEEFKNRIEQLRTEILNLTNKQ